MAPFDKSELVLIRHAPSKADNRLCGRVDAPARIDEGTALPPIRRLLHGVERRVTSPARRCRQTCLAIWPAAAELTADPRLWEQDFGDHDGQPFDRIPDLGALSPAELAAHRPPNGESFNDMLARARPALAEWADIALDGGPVAVVGHAGTVRAALALAMNSPPAALAFEVAPLSITRLRCHPGGLSVICTNWLAG